MTTKDLDSLANLWNKTKNPKYKRLWYKQVKEIAQTHGYYNSKRRCLPFNPNNEKNIGWDSTDK